MKTRKPIRRYTPLKRGRGFKTKKVSVEAEKDSWRNTDYYTKAIAISTWQCENCDAYIPHGQYWQKVTAQCHILPKGGMQGFPEVSGLIENRLHQCQDCHADWDSSWAKASTMRIFPLAMERLATFQHLLKKSLPKGLLAVLDKNAKHP